MYNRDKQFLRGFAAAIACIVRDHDEPTMALDICELNCVDLDEFKEAEVVNFDLEQIEKIFKED